VKCFFTHTVIFHFVLLYITTIAEINDSVDKKSPDVICS